MNRFLNKKGYEIIKIGFEIEENRSYSGSGEEAVISKYLKGAPLPNRYCVDIGASDGLISSNTLFLYQEGWSGTAVEYDAQKFARLAAAYKRFEGVCLLKTKIFPDNIIPLLRGTRTPRDLAFLNLDIDGYDYYVLDRFLSEYRPRLICAEINEKIPPPICFTVKFDPDFAYGGDHFFGQSLSQIFRLCEKYQYDLAEVLYNNAFLIPREIKNHRSLTPEEAYADGYRNKPDRKSRFPWNVDMEDLLSMTPEEGIQFIQAKFQSYKDRFICE